MDRCCCCCWIGLNVHATAKVICGRWPLLVLRKYVASYRIRSKQCHYLTSTSNIGHFDIQRESCVLLTDSNVFSCFILKVYLPTNSFKLNQIHYNLFTWVRRHSEINMCRSNVVTLFVQSAVQSNRRIWLFWPMKTPKPQNTLTCVRSFVVINTSLVREHMN